MTQTRHLFLALLKKKKNGRKGERAFRVRWALTFQGPSSSPSATSLTAHHFTGKSVQLVYDWVPHHAASVIKQCVHSTPGAWWLLIFPPLLLHRRSPVHPCPLFTKKATWQECVRDIWQLVNTQRGSLFSPRGICVSSVKLERWFWSLPNQTF